MGVVVVFPFSRALMTERMPVGEVKPGEVVGRVTVSVRAGSGEVSNRCEAENQGGQDFSCCTRGVEHVSPTHKICSILEPMERVTHPQHSTSLDVSVWVEGQDRSSPVTWTPPDLIVLHLHVVTTAESKTCPSDWHFSDPHSHTCLRWGDMNTTLNSLQLNPLVVQALCHHKNCVLSLVCDTVDI